ncbi:uncharacterized protein LOC126853340 isoform X2 [Cataglyphis hispanica]|uniref:uncharacterized protein LOC126853340 isoform X2 n=1 Tax=Cataglyphis hispanica TaxID=1086592 RepID=UPI00217F67D9|nr:uncharacterized protein LOC126853340 isoform X2 [Cataglyphis hispanica]
MIDILFEIVRRLYHGLSLLRVIESLSTNYSSIQVPSNLTSTYLSYRLRLEIKLLSILCRSRKMSNIYCICCKQLSNGNHKDIFDDKLLIKSKENNTNEEFDKCMILKDAIELITGYRISKIDNAVLCKICFQKVESYIIFRSQLVASFERANGTQVPDLISPNCKNMKFTETSKTQISDTGLEAFKEITNVCENNITKCDDLSSSESEINDSYSNVLPNFQSFADNISDSIDDFDDNSNVDISYPKIQKSDIESDVNVFSDEDNNEILELAIQSKHNDSINISLTESEEDYDYGPNVKKCKISSF